MIFKFSKFVMSIILYLIIALFIFFFFEGLSSSILALTKIIKYGSVREKIHTQYDELLGWINIPNLYIKDLYGHNIYMKTNSQGFRNSKEFSIRVPEDKIRIICSGDSFTFGHGVSNDKAWCQALTAFDNRIETVNMGHSGYGIDQAYLLYMRDGIKLDHNIQVFAFVADDFRRATMQKFSGHFKPVLKTENGKLVADNVPPPKISYSAKKIAILQGVLRTQLKSLELIKMVARRIGIKVPGRNVTGKKQFSNSEEHIRDLALKIIESLDKVNKKKDSILIAVYLPSRTDYDNEVFWRSFLAKELQKRGILFIDLTADFKNYSDSLYKLFITSHYSPFGNRIVARNIYEKLLTFPETATLFK